MKVIEMLDRISKGEEVPDFKYEECHFAQFNSSIHNDTDGKWVEIKIGNDKWKEIDYTFLNDEVEIIDKINKD